MSEVTSEIPDLEKIAPAKSDWKEVTKEGNRICQNLNKLIKVVPNEDAFKTDFILSMNDILNTVFEVINTKVPKLMEFLEHFNQPDWSRAFLSNDELRQPLKNPNAMADQLVAMETKLQLIVSKIPATDDIISALKQQYQSGQIASNDEFARN